MSVAASRSSLEAWASVARPVSVVATKTPVARATIPAARADRTRPLRKFRNPRRMLPNIAYRAAGRISRGVATASATAFPSEARSSRARTTAPLRDPPSP